MKRIFCKWWPLFLLLFVCVCVMIIVSSQLQMRKDTLPQDYYRVYVNDKAVDFYAKTSPATPHIMLPVLALFESLGKPATWQSDTVAHLSIADKTWKFDLADVSLRPLGSHSDVLVPPPGSKEGKHFERNERDAYVDSGSLGHVLYDYLCVRMVDIDDAQRVIRIYTK